VPRAVTSSLETGPPPGFPASASANRSPASRRRRRNPRRPPRANTKAASKELTTRHRNQEELTTNLTNLTNGTQFQGSPHDALVLEFAMRPGVYE
jgi:hypothetical protein